MDNILERIYKAGLKLLIPSTLEETYSTIVDEAVKLVGADNGIIHLEVDGEFKVVYATFPAFYNIKPRKKANVYKAFTTQLPIVADITDIGKAHPELRKLSIKSAVFIPLSYQNKSIGVLVVNKKNREYFDNKRLKILVLFGSMASLAIRKAQLYHEVIKALETRDMFISMAAHELRTPLTSVSGYIQLLRGRFSRANTSESRWIEQLYWESVRLNNLVQELLEINRIKTGQLKYILKECSLREILERVKNNFKFTHPERELIIEDKLKNKSDIVIGDHDKIIQLFTNLLDNAFKFSSSHTSVVLTLSNKDSSLLIEVKDQGIGISKEDKVTIFESYRRGKGHDKEGLGMGLFLVKNIAARHHGSVNIYSKPKKGTRVEVKFPQIRI